MSSRMDEVEKTTYQSYILGTGNQLVQGRTHKTEPTPVQLADQLVQFNYMKRDEFRATTVVVTKTVTTIEFSHSPTPTQIEDARKRIDTSKGIPS